LVLIHFAKYFGKTSCEGKSKIKLEIGNHKYDLLVVIIKNLAYDMILGMSFLKENKTVIDCEDNSFYSKNVEQQLFSCRDVEISPYSEMMIDAKTNFSSGSVGNVYYLEENPQFVNKSNVYVARGILECNKRHTKIVVANLSNKAVTIPANSCIGYLKLLEDFEVIENVNVFKEPTMEKVSTKLINDNIVYASNPVVNVDLDGNLSSEETKKVYCLLNEFSDIFVSKINGSGATSLVSHVIDVGTHSPINQSPYRTSIA